MSDGLRRIAVGMCPPSGDGRKASIRQRAASQHRVRVAAGNQLAAAV